MLRKATPAQLRLLRAIDDSGFIRSSVLRGAMWQTADRIVARGWAIWSVPERTSRVLYITVAGRKELADAA